MNKKSMILLGMSFWLSLSASADRFSEGKHQSTVQSGNIQARLEFERVRFANGGSSSVNWVADPIYITVTFLDQSIGLQKCNEQGPVSVELYNRDLTHKFTQPVISANLNQENGKTCHWTALLPTGFDIQSYYTGQKTSFNQYLKIKIKDIYVMDPIGGTISFQLDLSEDPENCTAELCPHLKVGSNIP